MNKLFILCGMVFLGITSTPQTPESDRLNDAQALTPVTLKVSQKESTEEYFTHMPCMVRESVSRTELDLASISYEETEEPVDLGFDPREYLPENFDPYKVYVDLRAIPFIENNEEDLSEGFLKGLLPGDFDPYAAPANIMDISYMEEADIELGFDSSAWLPEGFNPYQRDLDLDSIVYIEEEDLELGFDTSTYLPTNFDPYSL